MPREAGMAVGMDAANGALVAMSAALAQRPALHVGIEHGWFREPEAVRRRAAAVIADVPHPPGPKRASGLAWGEGEQMSSLSEGDIQLMVQANAMFDWLRYALGCAESGEIPSVARVVLRDLPCWPAIRGGSYEQELREAEQALAYGDLTRLRELVARPQPRRAT